MTTTDESLKRALARLLPERLAYIEVETEIVWLDGLYLLRREASEIDRSVDRRVLDTELLSLVREVELGLSLDQLTIYYNILPEICTEVPPLIAPWEKRVEGLVKLKDIEV